MYFDSLAAALAMGGHGAYVWASYAVTLAVVIYLVASPRRREKKLLRELRGEQRRAEARAAHGNLEVPQ